MMLVTRGQLVHIIANVLLREGVNVADTIRIALEISNQVYTVELRAINSTQTTDMTVKPTDVDPRD